MVKNYPLSISKIPSIALGCCGVLLAFPVSAMDVIRMPHYSSYQMEQHDRPHGAIDPYTGQYIDAENYIETDYSAPRMSYRNAISQEAEQPALSYQINNSLGLDFDPVTQRIDSRINLTGDDKRDFKLKVNTRQVKAMMVFKLN